MTKALSASGNDGAEVSGKTAGQCYWQLDLKNYEGSQFRIAQVGGNKNTATYVDNFSLYYTGPEGSSDMNVPGDVNGDKEVNIADVNAIIKIILAGGVVDETNKAADLNKDGEINIADINAVIGLILN